MKKMLSLFAAMIVVGIAAEEPAAPTPVKMNLANFRIYKAAANGGIVEKVAKTAENPEVRRKFVPDPSKEKYNVQLYGHDPASLDKTKTYSLTIIVSDDTNPDAAVMFSLKSKNKKYGWYGSMRSDTIKQLKLSPGKHVLTVKADLRTYKLPELGFICPTIGVTGLKSGSVVVESVEVITEK